MSAPVEMYMHIDDARHYIAAFCIYYLRIFYTDSFFNPCNNAVFDQNITDFVFWVAGSMTCPFLIKILILRSLILSFSLAVVRPFIPFYNTRNLS